MVTRAATKRRPATLENKSSQNVILLARPGETVPDAELFDATGMEEMPQDLALSSLLTQLGDSEARGKVTVEKSENVNGARKSVWLFECQPGEFSFRDVQEHYGAGDYRVKVYGPTKEGTEYFGVLSNKLYSIGAPRNAAPVAAVVAAPGNVAQEIVSALAPILAQLQGGNSREAMLREMAQMRELFMPAATMRDVTPQAPVDPFEQFQKFAVLMNNMKAAIQSDPDASGDPGSALMFKALDTFGEVVKNFKDRKSDTPQPALPAPAPERPAQPNPAAPSAVAVAKPEESDMAVALKHYVTMGNMGAMSDMDVESFALQIFEHSPDEVLSKILAPDWWEQLSKEAPACVPHKPWYEKLRARVLELEKEEAAAIEPEHPAS